MEGSLLSAVGPAVMVFRVKQLIIDRQALPVNYIRTRTPPCVLRPAKLSSRTGAQNQCENTVYRIRDEGIGVSRWEGSAGAMRNARLSRNSRSDRSMWPETTVADLLRIDSTTQVRVPQYVTGVGRRGTVMRRSSPSNSARTCARSASYPNDIRRSKWPVNHERKRKQKQRPKTSII